jgi:hypothetical protein
MLSVMENTNKMHYSICFDLFKIIKIKAKVNTQHTLIGTIDF